MDIKKDAVTTNKMPEILGKTQELAKAIAELNDKIAYLDTRLESVTRQEPREESGRPTSPTATTMGRSLQEMIDQVNIMAERVNDISIRLEI